MDYEVFWFNRRGPKMIKKYSIKNINLNSVKLDKSNPNKMSEQKLKSLRYALQKFGCLQPIIVDDQFNMVDGEHRWRAYQMEGELEIPAIIVPNCTPVMARLIRQTMNKLHGEHDDNLDALEYQKLMDDGQLGELSLLLSESENEFKLLIQEVEAANNPLAEKEEDFDVGKALEKAKYKIILGEVYELGSHRLLCGDATKKEYVDLLMNGEKADMVFTDPPYGVSIVSKDGSVGGGTQGKYKSVIGDEDTNTAKNAIKIIMSMQIPKILIWGGNYFTDILPSVSSWIIWDKQGGKHVTFADCEMAWTNTDKPARIFQHIWDGFRRDSEKGEMRIHPTQKPVQLCSECFEELGGKSVMDLFGGSGSTLIACEKTNRKCYMMEIDPHYCSVIIERWENFTGKKAVKVEGGC